MQLHHRLKARLLVIRRGPDNRLPQTLFRQRRLVPLDAFVSHLHIGHPTQKGDLGMSQPGQMQCRLFHGREVFDAHMVKLLRTRAAQKGHRWRAVDPQQVKR